MSPFPSRPPLVVVIGLAIGVAVLGLLSGATAASLTAADRQALREFQMNRLFAMLGYLQQDASGDLFEWNKVGFGEVGNAAVGVTEEGRKLPPVVQDLIAAHEKRHGGKNLLGAAAVAAMGGPRGLAKIELDHAIEDIRSIQQLLKAEPGASDAEASQLKKLEDQLYAKFKTEIPGLQPHKGGFLEGGRYLATAFANPAEIPFFTKAFGDLRLFLPTQNRIDALREAFRNGYETGRFPGTTGADVMETVREQYKKYGQDDELKAQFRKGFNRGRSAEAQKDFTASEKVAAALAQPDLLSGSYSVGAP